ncbi:ParB family chromosome partitioning protein [Undibacterium sp. GrIS 1.2]|uniref:PRTRC system ParB family protein n=1 Tax=Undibacterium sp. GrIS 1.2 TaxID=3143933 RepID=UPI0033998A63
MQTETQLAVIQAPTFYPRTSITLENGRVINEQSQTAPVWALVRGKNPRTYFDPVAMAELEATLPDHGIIQPIIVRVNEDNLLEIVAGERRYRAACKILGEDYEMPISFKNYDQSKADAIAVIENHHRDNVSRTEEANNAAKTLAQFNGDRVETAKYLGWSPTILDNRLALLALSSEVQQALNERKIDLGTAELLATISRERQNMALPIILEKKLSIKDIKQTILAQSKQMAIAIFDKSECATCQFNTDLQSSLFAENLGTGSCSNSVCYDKKTDEELELRKKSLEDEYPVVKFVRPGDNFSVIRIVADGQKGVGEEQAIACKACKNYGGAISMLPDSFGKAFKSQCFDLKCHGVKVEIYKKSLLPPADPTSNSSAEKASTSPATSGTVVAIKSTDTSKAETAPKAVLTSVADSNRVKDYREQIWREALKADVAKDHTKALSLLFGMAATRNISHIQSDKIADVIKAYADKEKDTTQSVSGYAKLADTLDDQTRSALLNGLSQSAVNAVEVRHLTDMMEYLQVDLSKHWKMNAEFLKLLTKSEIEVVAHDIGLKKYLDKSFAGLMNKSKDDFIKSLMTCGFSFDGIIPKVMSYAK